jgi:hypothetical protein
MVPIVIMIILLFKKPLKNLRLLIIISTFYVSQRRLRGLLQTKKESIR